jgi:hypothetical protein
MWERLDEALKKVYSAYQFGKNGPIANMSGATVSAKSLGQSIDASNFLCRMLKLEAIYIQFEETIL